MGKKRSHGKIDRLPEVLRREVENKLIEGRTYNEIAEYLKSMGQDIHAMSVGRYGKPFLERFEAIQSYAKAISEDNADRPTTELHEANNAMISQILMETLISDDVDPTEKIKVANSIAHLQSAQIRNEKLKIDARKAKGELEVVYSSVVKEFTKILKHDYPELMEKFIEVLDNAKDALEKTI